MSDATDARSTGRAPSSDRRLGFKGLLARLLAAWRRLGELIGAVVSPIVLAVLYLVVLTPVAVAGRLLGRDELRLRRTAVASYWRQRTPPGPAPDSLRHPF